MKYRSDIDGLRAMAVLPVVLFHAGVGRFSGGFIGVDVFFVISGFLITSLIEEEIRQGRFSIIHFYERRIRRIIPALFNVILFSCIAAKLILTPADFHAFGRSVTATVFFGSNLLFWSESGYFDAPAESKPLLHTWSLAVEEQFYLFFPVFLVLIRRFFRDRWVLVLGLVAVASFGLSVTKMMDKPQSAFYLAQYRAWELLLGSLAAVGAFPRIKNQVAREATAILGVVAIAWSVFAYSPSTVFPGVSALLPCAGTLMLIQAGGSGGSATNRILGLKPFMLLGLISYSLYLWHWPLIVFAEQLALRKLTGLEIALLVMLSVVLAALSWRLVERPFRNRASAVINRRTLFTGTAVLMIAALPFGDLGQIVRLPGQDKVAETRVRGWEDYQGGNCFILDNQTFTDWSKKYPCVTNGHAKHTILLWGDSFAAQYIPGLATSNLAKDYRIVQYTAERCPPVLDVDVPQARNCRDFNLHIKNILDRYDVETVILTARWERYWGGIFDHVQLEATVRYLKSRNVSVVLVGQGPSFEFISLAAYINRTGRTSAWPKNSRRINRELMDVVGYDAFFDPNQFLCQNEECPLMSHGEYLYMDAGHYSTRGSILIADNLVRVVSSLKAMNAGMAGSPIQPMPAPQ